MRHSQTVFVLISIDTLQSPSGAQRQNDRVGARTARPLRVWARIFRAHIPAHLPVPGLIRPAACGIQSPTILHRPSHSALHSPLPAPQLAFPALRRRSPRPPATYNTPELPQRRASTWRPVHCGLLRASFSPPVHDATSTLAAVFGALASLPPDPAERGAMPCRTSCRTLASAMSRVARSQANSVTVSRPSGRFHQHCSSASSRRVGEATKTDVWSSLPT